MIKGLIFDLDGVITETDKLHFEAWRDEVKKIGINLTKENNSKLKGLPRMDTLFGILKIYNKNDLPEEQIIEISDNKNKAYLKKLNDSLSEKNILPGIKKFLEESKEKKLKLAIASSSNNAPLILEKLKLNKYFDFIVDPSTIKNGKPAPDIYLKAAEGINLKPHECIGFEDALPGIEGLSRGKIPSVAITHAEEGDWSKASIILESTNQLNLNKIIRTISK